MDKLILSVTLRQGVKSWLYSVYCHNLKLLTLNHVKYQKTDPKSVHPLPETPYGALLKGILMFSVCLNVHFQLRWTEILD